MKSKQCYETHTNCNGDTCNLDRVKWVDFAYPTSEHAKKFNAYNTGCWIVYTQTRKGKQKVFSAHETEQDAIKSANTLPCEWWSVYVNQGRKVA